MICVNWFEIEVVYGSSLISFDFLWYLGNTAPDITFKNIILQNVSEEFGQRARSHEQLYFSFSADFQVDLTDELVNQTSYADCVKAFNSGHIAWLATHEWDACFAAFAAYEKLDNLDYPDLHETACLMGASGRGLAFFKVHMHVEHFENTLSMLEPIWARSPAQVQEAFDFIASHQLTMWEAVFALVSGKVEGA